MAAPGIVTSGTGPPNAVVQVQPGMQVQPVVLVDANGNYVTTSGSTATAGYLADLTGSVNVSQAAAPTTGQVLTATSGTTATWQSGSTETAGYLATQTTSVYVAGGSAPTAGQELIATSGSAATWQFGASGVLTTLGDMLFENSTPALARLAGNTSAAKMFLTQTGNGGTSAAPAWGTIASADLPPSVALSGTPTAPTGTLGDTSTQIATDAFVGAAVGPYAKQTLASPAASITFSSIPAGYNLLRLLVVGASAAAAEFDRWLVTVNGDTGAHYDLQESLGNNGTAASGVKNAQGAWESASSVAGELPAASAASGVAGTLDILIPAYAGTTFQKVGSKLSGYSDAATSASDQVTIKATIAWRSTAAITSITVTLLSGSNLVTGTTALLYLS